MYSLGETRYFVEDYSHFLELLARTVTDGSTIDTTLLLWIITVISAAWIVLDALMIHGINKGKPGLMMPWLFTTMMFLLSLTIGSVAGMFFFDPHFEKAYHGMSLDTEDVLMIIVKTAALILVNALGYYIWAIFNSSFWEVIKSAYEQTEEGRPISQYQMSPYQQIPMYETNNLYVGDQRPSAPVYPDLEAL